MKNNLFAKKISLLLTFVLAIHSSSFAVVTPSQLVQLNTNKRSLKNSLSELIECLQQHRACDAETKKAIKHILIIVGVLGVVATAVGISLYAAHKTDIAQHPTLIPYKLLITSKYSGIDEEYKTAYDKLSFALSENNIVLLKDAIKEGALHYPDSQFALFDARSVDAVNYLLANYPRNKTEILNAKKEFTAGSRRKSLMSPLAHHREQRTSLDVENVLKKFSAEDFQKDYLD
jgi:hypothetical protein